MYNYSEQNKSEHKRKRSFKQTVDETKTIVKQNKEQIVWRHQQNNIDTKYIAKFSSTNWLIWFTVITRLKMITYGTVLQLLS